MGFNIVRTRDMQDRLDRERAIGNRERNSATTSTASKIPLLTISVLRLKFLSKSLAI
jgi:hypothetical protein